MSAKDKRDKIRDTYINGQQKKVLLVEGTDDVSALQILLAKFCPDWEQRWVVAEAGNKKMVLEILGLEPDWLGLVDRDEWDQAQVSEQQGKRPNLMVMPRFCFENYLIVPSELWSALPEKQQTTVTGALPAFEERLLAKLPEYVRHGVLWHVVSPLWSGLRALGFKDRLAAEDSVSTAQNDQAIRNVLDEWDVLLNPETIFTQFQTTLLLVKSLPPDEQLKHWVHGKTYLSKVVRPEMTRLFGQVADKKFRRHILERLPAWPADLQSVLTRLQ